MNTDKATSSPRKGGLYLDISELDSMNQYIYLFGLGIGITSTYLVLGHFILPMIAAGAISMPMFYGITIGVAVLWLGLVKLFNKYWLQNKLIDKGTLC